LRAAGRAVMIGASFVEQGCFNALQGLAGGRLVWIEAGTGGERSDEILARFETDVLDVEPQLVLIDSGGNDVLQGASAATVIANNTEMYEMAEAAGIKIMVATMQSLGGTANYTEADEIVRVALNNFESSTGYPCFNYDQAMGNGASPPAVNPAYDVGDGLHLNAAGKKACGELAFIQLFGGRAW
jgi:lysophospholipase L1-like esterase